MVITMRWVAAAIGLGLLGGCGTVSSSSGGGGSVDTNQRASDAKRRFPLDRMQRAAIQAKGETITVWLARTPDEQEEGLMHVPAAEIGDREGMLFVFPDERPRGFWMKNTITSLDIAYARVDGTIVRTWTMPPLTLQSFPSVEPAMFALEMKAGMFEQIGLKAGDRLVIPPEVSQTSP